MAPVVACGLQASSLKSSPHGVDSRSLETSGAWLGACLPPAAGGSQAPGSYSTASSTWGGVTTLTHSLTRSSILSISSTIARTRVPFR
eukprot:1179520-Prorocentrum_minimum.AAC.6